MSYNEACFKDGKDVIDEMIDHGTMITRTMKRLPPNSKIPFPFNQEVAYTKEKWRAKETRTEEEERRTEQQLVEGEGNDDAAKFTAKFHAAQSSAGSAPKIDETPPPQKDDPPPKPKDDKGKAAVAEIRKTHSVFDKTIREWHGLIAMSEKSDITGGCKFEQLLNDTTRLDEENMQVERKYLSGTTLLDDDIRTAAARSGELAKLMKDGNKKAAMLMTWLKFKE